MGAKIELNINDDSYDAFRELIAASNTAIVGQIPLLEDALKTTIDISQQNNIRNYISKSLLQLAVLTHILDGMPERPQKSKLILPNGNA